MLTVYLQPARVTGPGQIMNTLHRLMDIGVPKEILMECASLYVGSVVCHKCRQNRAIFKFSI